MRLQLKLITIALVLLAMAGCSTKEKLVLPAVQNSIQPTVVWKTKIGKGVAHFESSLQPLIVEQTVYAASRQGIVAAYDLTSGKRHWQFDLRQPNGSSAWQGISNLWSDGNARISGGVSYGYGKLFLGTENGEVFALAPETGELLWRVEVKGEVLAKPVIGEGLVIVATGAGGLIALHPDDGEQRWEFETEQPSLTLRGVSQPVIHGGGVIYGSGSGHLGVVLADRGYQAWEEQISVPAGTTDLSRLADIDAAPIVVGSVIIAIGFNGELVALDIRSGKALWKREYSSFRNMAMANDTLYLVDSEGRISALDNKNGTEIWTQYGLHKHFLTGATVYKNYIVIGDSKGNLHWLDRSDGRFVARQSMDSSGFYTEAVANAEYLLVQSRNGELVLLQTP
ncbi:outer membrane protein assembly factor BamB [Rheinheimera sp. MMS21-TC3]|uniref:outer membrane protein assembly factor BamB n=1 Tax=Rheinheimera sp. MMS21-TC3 TaxID=3072790 RepID=UPI0028C46BD8|nr:outer membrane protein assembly factor BamB [Rheinheimera sp. MMS21-TC3]WNO60263.1 outer membrane protein assembly factor BamB [Rheinheimera sp. MMS21-TC3]